MPRKRLQVDDRAATSVTEPQDRNTCTTSSVARSSNNILNLGAQYSIWLVSQQLEKSVLERIFCRLHDFNVMCVTHSYIVTLYISSVLFRY